MAQIKKLKQGETTIFPVTDASAVQYAGKTLSEMTGGGVYSTQPVKIGTWINGETIYRVCKVLRKPLNTTHLYPYDALDEFFFKDTSFYPTLSKNENNTNSEGIVLSVSLVQTGEAVYEEFLASRSNITSILNTGKINNTSLINDYDSFIITMLYINPGK